LKGACWNETLLQAGARLIPLTVPQVQELLLRLLWDWLTSAGQALAWSRWRRRHQQRAQECHHRKRHAGPLDCLGCSS